MKVCITSDVFPPDVGGIQTFTHGLAENLSKEETIGKVTVVTFGNKKLGREKISEKLEIYRLSYDNLLTNSISFLCKLSKKKDHDVFHSITLFPAGFLTACLTRFILDKKFFVTIFGLDVLGGLKNWKTRLPIKWTLDRADRIVAFSNSTKKEVGKIYRSERDKIITIYPGAPTPVTSEKEDINSLREHYGLSNDDFVVLFLGRLVKRKGIDDLIKGIEKTGEEKINLLIAGDGPEKERLKKLSQILELEHRTHFIGEISHPKTHHLYKLADAFCMPSKYIKEREDVEGLGLVFIEAQSYGVPVIGTDSGGIPEAIEDGKTGFIVPEGSPNFIADRLLTLMNNKRIEQRMKNRGPKFIEEKFNWKKCVDEHIKLYMG